MSPEVSTEPVETPADQDARAARIQASTNSLVFSTSFAETRGGSSFQYQPSCSETECTFTGPYPSSEYSFTSRLSDFYLPRIDEASAILTKYGITLLQGNAEGIRVDVGGLSDLRDFDLFYSWMNHVVFAVSLQEASDGTDYIYGSAAGELAGTRSSGIAGTWRGLMIGRPQSGAFRGNKLQGDATLTYTGGAASELDVVFTNIQDLDRDTNYSTTSVAFNDIQVEADGTYRAGFVGNAIQGGFYGPRREEAAGVFEQAGIVGAFGAKRQQ